MLFITLLCCVLSLRVLHSDAAVQLDVNPSTIELDFTTSLTVNCTFTYDPSSAIFNLVSIILSKNDNDGSNSSFHELLSITSFVPDVVSVGPQVNATASGHIDNSGVSYLSLYWTYPSIKESGVYLCTVNGVDRTGHPTFMSSTGEIKAFKTNIDQLMEIVRNQQTELNHLQKTLTDFETTITKLVTSMNATLSQIDNKLIIDDNFQKSVEYKGTFYYLSKSEVVNVDLSQRRCEELGGYLAEIEDASENSLVKNLIDMSLPTHAYLSVLIGGTNNNSSQWTWRYSHRPMNFTDWASGYPYESGSEHCLYLFRVYDWQWRDTTCNSVAYFICEVEKH